MSFKNLTQHEMAKMMAASGYSTFEPMIREVKEWEAAVKRGDTEKIKSFDWSVAPVCARCFGVSIDPAIKHFTPMRCGGCLAVIYCSRACQLADWKTSLQPRAPTHKQLCARNKEHMKRLPYYRSVFEQFPWARIESDGTCSHDHLRARFGVLGSSLSFGYWAIPGGIIPHDAGRAEMSQDGGNAKKKRGSNQKSNRPYSHGDVMLGKEWPSDVEGWSLNDQKAIPRLRFADERMAPEKPKPGQIKDWSSWYEWRGLGLESPAALIMDYPLSVYHLLVDVLKVVDPVRASEGKQTLDVHYIGVEVELNFLPLFSELALLLPNTHINLTVFGKAGRDLVLNARQSYPGSLATRNPVWSYTAPKKTGGGSIDIRIYTQEDDWTRRVLVDGKPDAMVGLNAGLLSYPSWMEPIVISGMFDIPFAVTEYAEQSMETFATNIPIILAAEAPRVGLASPEYFNALTKKRAHPICVNPFHRVGQRNVAQIRMPNHYNGFSMPVIVRDSV